MLAQLTRKSDNAVIATFEKGRWASYSKSIRSGGPPNKKKQLIGKLQVNSPSATTSGIAMPLNGPNESALWKVTGRIDDAISGGPKTDYRDLNIHGSHTGDLTVDAIALTCWIVVETEHRLRYKVLDILEEIGESAGG